MIDDTELLRRYVESRDEAAFSELVRRHVDLVHSVALRQVNGDAHLAADVTQAVFTDFARKAATLGSHRVLTGWFFTSARFAAAKAVRSEQRRHAREQEAHIMQENSSDPNATLDWERVRPVLDEAIAELRDDDREAVLLRFFEARDYASIGAKLNLNDNTARMRVERALDRLRGVLERRGVTSTSGALAIALANQAVFAAPAGLAVAVTGAALAGGGAAAATTLGAGGGAAAAAATFMGMSKLQLGIAGALVAGGAASFVIQAQGNAALNDELARLRAENQTIATLHAENQRLAAVAAEVAELRKDDAELARLRDEAEALKTKLAARPAAPVVTKIQPPPPASDLGLVYQISQLDQTPVPRFQARPQYPFELRRNGVGGDVLVEFVVDNLGNVRNARAVKSSRTEFEAAAVDSVMKWKFKPGVKSGLPVNTQLQVPIVFSVKAPETGAAASSAPEKKPEPPPGY